MKAYYPISTSDIFHKGKKGNTYRLDGFDKCIRLYEKIRKDNKFETSEVGIGNNESLAQKLILLAHDKKIISAYKNGVPQSLANSSGIMWQPKLKDYVFETALSCKLGVDSAVIDRRSLIITGGGHHSEHATPLGFGAINAMAISAIYAHEKYGLKTVLIDSDVHYGNGCCDILKKKKGILSCGIWNKKLDKWKYYKSIGNLWHRQVENKKDYFKEIDNLILKIEKFKPEFIIYHLGLDVLDSDRMGGISDFKTHDLYKREKNMSKFFDSLNIPCVIFLGGSYVDYSKGENSIKIQQKTITDLYYDTLSYYV